MRMQRLSAEGPHGVRPRVGMVVARLAERINQHAIGSVLKAVTRLAGPFTAISAEQPTQLHAGKRAGSRFATILTFPSVALNALHLKPFGSIQFSLPRTRLEMSSYLQLKVTHMYHQILSTEIDVCLLQG